MKFKNIMLKIFSIIFSSAIISNGSSFCPHISAMMDEDGRVVYDEYVSTERRSNYGQNKIKSS